MIFAKELSKSLVILDGMIFLIQTFDNKTTNYIIYSYKLSSQSDQTYGYETTNYLI